MKKRLGKILFLFIAFHLLGLAACDDDLDCGNFKQQFYEVIELNLANFSIDESTIPDTYTRLEDSSFVQLDDFRLAFETEVEYFTDNTPLFFSNPFIQSALACSPAPPEPAEIITAIEITNISDLVTFEGDTLQAGTELTDVLFSNQRNSTLTELIEMGDFTPPDSGFPSGMFALSAFPVDFSQPHQFSVVYRLDSGNSFNATSPVLFFFQ